MACECVKCGDCNGNGYAYGVYSADDLDLRERCDTCGGSGIGDTCWECQEALVQDD